MDPSERQNPQPDDGGRPQRPWWLVGLALVAIIVIAVGAGIFASRKSQPSVGISSVPTRTVTRRPTASGGTLTGTQSSIPATPTVATVSVASPTATRPATPTASPVPVVVAPGATPAPPGTAKTVVRAYLHYWDVYANALYTLDTSRLAGVMAGTELAGRRQQINELRSQHQAAKIDVEHHYEVVLMGPSKAGVEDHYLNKSYTIDATTKRPLQSPGAGETEDVAFQLEIVNGTWKVVSSSQVNR